MHRTSNKQICSFRVGHLVTMTDSAMFRKQLIRLSFPPTINKPLKEGNPLQTDRRVRENAYLPVALRDKIFPTAATLFVVDADSVLKSQIGVMHLIRLGRCHVGGVHDKPANFMLPSGGDVTDATRESIKNVSRPLTLTTAALARSLARTRSPPGHRLYERARARAQMRAAKGREGAWRVSALARGG